MEKQEILNEKIEKIRIGRYMEHCALCDRCLMPISENCEGLDYKGGANFCEKCDSPLCEVCFEKHNKYCDGLIKKEEISGNRVLETKTVREGFEEALKRGYFDKGLYKYLDDEVLEEIKINIDSEDLKREIEEYGKIDINEMDIAFKNLEKALISDDTPEHWLAFKKFQFWLALRQIPIKIADLYMYMGNMGFKNIRFRSYIFIDENRVDIDYKGYYDSVHKIGDYAKKEESQKLISKFL